MTPSQRAMEIAKAYLEPYVKLDPWEIEIIEVDRDFLEELISKALLSYGNEKLEEAAKLFIGEQNGSISQRIRGLKEETK